jgi:hypothetical protein
VRTAIPKKELPVEIIARVGVALQELFGPLAEEAARASGVIVRRRKFTARTLARTFVPGFLRHPRASAEELARVAVECGAEVTPQAVDQRHTPRLAKFLEDLFGRAARLVVASNRALAPLLERFASVTVLDSSTITLPDELGDRFPGCGGGAGGGAAALKLQTELDLRSGAITHVAAEPGRHPDGATGRQQARHGPGSLRVTDLAYFSLGVFAALAAAVEYFLSRLQPHTRVALPGGAPLDLLPWLEGRPGPFVDRAVLLGAGARLPCRLVAWRLPPEQVHRRRQNLRRDYRDKYGREPSAALLAWCAWTVLVTNVPAGTLTPAEAAVLYRARWPVELLFKRWKSQDRVALLTGSTPARQMAGVWGAAAGGLGAALAGAGRRLERPHQEPGQGGRGGPRARRPAGGRPGPDGGAGAGAGGPAPRGVQDLPPRQALPVGDLRTTQQREPLGLLLNLMPMGGQAFDPNSTAQAVGLSYETGTPGTSHFATLNIGGANNISTLQAALGGDQLTLGVIANASGGLGSVAASAAAITVTGLDTTHAGAGNVDLKAAGPLTVAGQARLATGWGRLRWQRGSTPTAPATAPSPRWRSPTGRRWCRPNPAATPSPCAGPPSTSPPAPTRPSSAPTASWVPPQPPPSTPTPWARIPKPWPATAAATSTWPMYLAVQRRFRRFP